MSGRIISKAEGFSVTYHAFQDINFTAFDYNTVKQSLIDYVKLYFSDSFNDYIESSEFIAILELFAYLAEVLIYRVDVAAQENFLPTAQRKQSVLRLAKLISYGASRNLPARGLVKITSISTSDSIFDSNGVNLQNISIKWNDAANPSWKEQFFLVMNLILNQPFGTISPSERIQVQDVLFELYTLNSTTPNGVLPYSAATSGQTLSMELVSSSLNTYGPYEKRPEINSAFTILYGNDGLGDSSNTTGFFIFTKQGTLQKTRTSFDGRTPNQTFQVGVNNINDIDVWVNNVDATTGAVIDDGTNPFGPSGAWIPVDVSNAANILFNTNPNPSKYEIETLENDDINLIFGDGQFATIPSGTFDVWYRVSANQDITIPQTSVANVQQQFPYLDSNGQNRSLTFTFSLTTTLQNASASEDIEHIRKFAPGVYYSQDRMVNARDYNTFMLQDTTILKLLSVNRTFSGESKYSGWLTFGGDPSETYDNVRMFGADLALYYNTDPIIENIVDPVSETTLVTNYIEPLLGNVNLWQYRATLGYSDLTRKLFTTQERDSITYALGGLGNPSPAFPVQIYYDQGLTRWRTTILTPYDADLQLSSPVILISIDKPIIGPYTWIISYQSTRIIAESPNMRFWFTNKNKVSVFDTLFDKNDTITILQANIQSNRTTLFPDDQNYVIIGSVANGAGDADPGLVNIHQVEITSIDANNDGFPDNVTLTGIIDPSITVTTTGSKTLPISYIANRNDLVLTSGTATFTENTPVSNTFTVNSVGSSATFTVNDYVYFYRPSINDPWTIVTPTDIVKEAFDVDSPGSNSGTHYKRERGRNSFNFFWMHHSPNYHLIDPAATNIIDTFIISRSYYNQVVGWLDGILLTEPTPPTPLDLRTTYGYLLDNAMISDSVILHPGKFKIVFGKHAIPELQAQFQVIRSNINRLTDNQIKANVVTAIKSYFDINKWEFGETFFFTELAAVIHASMPSDIDSVILIPIQPNSFFEDTFEIKVREDEIIIPSIDIEDVVIVTSVVRKLVV